MKGKEGTSEQPGAVEVSKRLEGGCSLEQRQEIIHNFIYFPSSDT